jgi:hypothetical protein
MSTTGYKRDNVGLYIIKDPDSTLDYTIDWTDWLSTSETVSSVSYTVPSGISTSTAIGGTATATTSTTTRVTLTGGTAGTIYTIKASMETNQGRTVVRNFRVKVEDAYL